MITVSILEEDDIIQPNDWCRPLQLVSMSGGHSDAYSFESQYSGTPENNVKWVRACDVFGPCWFSKPHSVRSINDGVHLRYEFVRGDIPKSHQYDPTKLRYRP